MSLNMEDIKFEIDNPQEHPLAYMLGSNPGILYPSQPKVGQYSYFDPRAKGEWVVKIQALNGVRVVGCVMSSPHQIVPRSYITCHGKIIEIVGEYRAMMDKTMMNTFRWPSDEL